ncbi:MAG: hypothetical protein HYV09_03235 [Deltaproteobacteria bacterium]|nr:hypothetical protein [Deltaproteobacteria bacterium]
MPFLPLVTAAQHYLKTIGFVRPVDLGGQRLKSMIADGKADIERVAVDVLRVELSEQDVAVGLAREWRLGFTRVAKQNDALTAMKANTDIPTSWVLVSCYYAAFFAAIELLRVQGRMVFYFEPDDISRIRQYSSGAHPIAAGNYAFEFGQAAGGTVVFLGRKTAERPHHAVWKHMGAALGCLNCSDDTAVRVRRLLEFMGSVAQPEWPSLNETRNRWNYAAPELYGTTGEKEGKHFRQLVGDDKALFAWARSRAIKPTTAEAPVPVALTQMLLLKVVRQLHPILVED